MLENGLVMVAIIFLINIVYVSFLTMRTILTLKGQRYLAAVAGTMEIAVYVIGLGLVLDNLGEIQNIIAYALGFGVGIIVGMKIEEYLALGYITVNAITTKLEEDIPNKLRDVGYGVTHYLAHGRQGERLVMQILTSRKSERKLYQAIEELDPKAFVISYEPRTFHGGFWVRKIRR